MTNNQAIAYIKGIILRYRKMKNKRNVLLYIEEKDIEAFEYAVESLQTDEAYNLMHENIPFVILPENATNGNVMLKLFPNSKYKIVDNGIEFKGIIDDNTEFTTWFPIEWWNAPYREKELTVEQGLSYTDESGLQSAT